MAISVDLPEPEGPTSATNSPSATVRSMPRRACTALPLLPNTLVSWWVSMMGGMARRLARCGGPGAPGAAAPVKGLESSVVLVVLLDLLARRVLQADLLSLPQRPL